MLCLILGIFNIAMACLHARIKSRKRVIVSSFAVGVMGIVIGVLSLAGVV